ncbi:MAG TPA: site-2 protease family protein [Candidatus Paceibacterota bacterium]|nr:site-2 protease family protein [Candidatus Paceibacterota bacterium]
MKWSWRLFKIAGIGVYVHVTFFLLLFVLGAQGYAARHQWLDAVGEVGFIITLFFIVVLHELGHALTARRFGIATKDITLLPIGGVARLERMPEDPKQELAVALAGPAVNVVLALILFVGLYIFAGLTSMDQMLANGGDFFARLLIVNVFLAIFNLLPAFPMDGGRVLRALLAIRMNYVRATRIAANIGQGMAFLFVMVGLGVLSSFGVPGSGNPFLILIAIFVWMGAAQEAGMVEMKSALNGAHVSDVMIRDFKTLAPEDTLARAAEHLLAGYQQDFPVLSEGCVIGMLTRSALIQGLAKLGGNMPVADAMEKDFSIADPGDLAETNFVKLQATGCRSTPVVEDGHLLGILTCENVGEFLMVRAALHNDHGTGHVGARLVERHSP